MKATIIKYANKKINSTNKKVYFIVVAFVLFSTIQSTAQVAININIGSSRPVILNQKECNDRSYYYLPEIEAYYDVTSSVYIYFGQRGWTRSRYLPEYCHNYNLNRGYKVVLDYHGNAPYAFYKQHKAKYNKNCHQNYNQDYYYPNRREGRNNDYVMVSDHNDYDDDNNYYKKEKHHDNKGRGHGNGYGRR